MQIRLATAEDLPAILRVVSRVVPLMQASGNLQWASDYPNAAVFQRDFELSQLWVAGLEDRVVGFAAITTDQAPEYANVGWDTAEVAIVVHRLAVDPDAQGKGIAAALMQHAETVAREREIGVLRVDTNTFNLATQKLFPVLGYRLAGETGFSFRPRLRFLCYEKRLRLAEEPVL